MPQAEGRLLLLAALLLPHLGCADDLAHTSPCEASQPVQIAELPPHLHSELAAHRAGDYFYINVNSAGVYGGQTWVTGLCGEDAALIAEGHDFGYLRPPHLAHRSDPPADRDPTLLCRGGRLPELYRFDPTAPQTPPALLLSGWSCQHDPTRPVHTFTDGDQRNEQWRVPNFPDLSGATLLAAGIQTHIAQDITFNYYLDLAQNLHAVDVTSGADTILAAGVLRARGGPTGPSSAGPTRLLVLTDSPPAVHLYRGDTQEILKIADAQPTDHPEPPQNHWAWDFDASRAHIYHFPYSDEGARAFDLDGAPLLFPAQIRLETGHLHTGVVGSIPTPGGRAWVHAIPGQTEPTLLSIPWDPAVSIHSSGPESVDYQLAGRTYRAPLSGAPAVELPASSLHYSQRDLIAVHDEQLVHVDPGTGAITPLQSHVSAHVPAVRDPLPAAHVLPVAGVFYTDTSAADRTRLMFMPAALLPNTP
jgi:hypothetical protein